MSSRHVTPRLPRLATVLVLLGVVLSAVGAGLAWAGDQAIDRAEYPNLIRYLVGTDEALKDGTVDSDRDGVLNKLFNTPEDSHAGVYGDVLGPVFNDPANTAKLDDAGRRKLFSRMIRHLADQQAVKSGIVLLAEGFFPHLVNDPELLALVRKELRTDDFRTGRKKGWERILDRARSLLDHKDPSVRNQAIRISAQCDCADMADAAAALHDALKASAGPMSGEDEAAFLDAGEFLLQHRFPDVAQLRTFLAHFEEAFAKRESWNPTDRYRVRGDLLSAVIRLLRETGGAQRSAAQRHAEVLGRLLIEKATKPEDLLAFFDPQMQRVVELQRAALAAARTRMKPTPDEGWAQLLRGALTRSTDREVLEATIEILGSTFSNSKRGDQAKLLAADVATRLQQGAATDDPGLRAVLAKNLGAIGSLADVTRALPKAVDLEEADPAQIPVYGQLIGVLGAVADAQTISLGPYYKNSLAGGRSPEWQRLAVAKALGYPGIRGNPLQKHLAGLFLRHILDGRELTAADNAAVGIPPDEHFLREEAQPEDAADVRAAAIDSLQWHPGEATAALLGRIAGDESAAAPSALRILGFQLGRGSVDAAGALAGLVKAEASDALVTAVFDTILSEDAKKIPAEALDKLSPAVRMPLEQDRSPALQAKAAQTAIHLGDATALKPIRILWGSQAAGSEERQAWGNRLITLFAASSRNEKNDEELATQLREMATEEHRDAVLGFFSDIGKAAERRRLKQLRADIHYERVSDDRRARADRRKDLDTAARLYAELIGTEKRDVRLYRDLYRMYVKGSEFLADGESANPSYLKAFRLAAESKDAELARSALATLAKPLEQGDGLTDEEKQGVAKLKATLEEAAEK